MYNTTPTNISDAKHTTTTKNRQNVKEKKLPIVLESITLFLSYVHTLYVQRITKMTQNGNENLMLALYAIKCDAKQTLQINTIITNKKYFHLSDLISAFAKSFCLSLTSITGHSLYHTYEFIKYSYTLRPGRKNKFQRPLEKQIPQL